MTRSGTLPERCGESELGEEFGDVAHFGGELRGLRLLGVVFGEQVRVFLERGAASGSVGEDGVEIVRRKGGEIRARKVAGHVAHAGVGWESAAAGLRRPARPLRSRSPAARGSSRD